MPCGDPTAVSGLWRICHVSAATLKLFGILPMIQIGLEPKDGEWSTDG